MTDPRVFSEEELKVFEGFSGFVKKHPEYKKAHDILINILTCGKALGPS